MALAERSCEEEERNRVPRDKMREYFADWLRYWHIKLPGTLAPRGKIHGHGWWVQYLFGSDEKGEHLDFYAHHRMTNDRHTRVYADGSVVDLPAPLPLPLPYDPNLPGDRERARREYHEHNRMVEDLLRRKGFE